MKLLAEYPRFYERGFREQSSLLEQCQKTNMLLVRKTYHHTILCCVRLRRTPSLAPTVGLISLSHRSNFYRKAEGSRISKNFYFGVCRAL